MSPLGPFELKTSRSAMLPSVELRYVTFEVSSFAFQMRRPVHRRRSRPEWVLYPLQDEKYEDIDVDVPASQII